MRKVIEIFANIAVVYWIATAAVADVGFWAVMGYAALGLFILGTINWMITEF